jgi:hypothetical protein
MVCGRVRLAGCLTDRLGVAPNALSTHVRGKADLTDGLIDQVYAGLTLTPDPTGDWTQQLTTLSQQIRDHLLAHPAVVPYALQQPRISTDDQFQFGIRTFLAGLNAHANERPQPSQESPTHE